MSRIYIDACVMIYLIEGAPPSQSAARRVISALRTSTDAVLLTCHLSRLECRVRPLRARDEATLGLYEAFFGRRGLEWISLSAAVIDRATEIRALYGFKTPDSLHLAAAVEGGATHFVTGDRGLAAFPLLPIQLVEIPSP